MGPLRNGDNIILSTVEPLLRGHTDERSAPLERSLDNVNLNINVLNSTTDERPPFFKGHISDAKMGFTLLHNVHENHSQSGSIKILNLVV